MALTLTRKAELIGAPAKVTRITIDFDSSYPTGGEVLSADKFIRGGKVLAVFIEERPKYSFRYDIANDKVLVFQLPTVATANADATYGQPEADLINEIKADINAGREEVPAATDLSTLTGVEVTIFHS